MKKRRYPARIADISEVPIAICEPDNRIRAMLGFDDEGEIPWTQLAIKLLQPNTPDNCQCGYCKDEYGAQLWY